MERLYDISCKIHCIDKNYNEVLPTELWLEILAFAVVGLHALAVLELRLVCKAFYRYIVLPATAVQFRKRTRSLRQLFSRIRDHEEVVCCCAVDGILGRGHSDFLNLYAIGIFVDSYHLSTACCNVARSALSFLPRLTELTLVVDDEPTHAVSGVGQWWHEGTCPIKVLRIKDRRGAWIAGGDVLLDDVALSQLVS